MTVQLQAIPTSIGSQVEQVRVQVAQAARTVPQSVSGRAPSGENGSPQNFTSRAGPAPDEVKVQLEPPGEIVVYQFVDQHGRVVLQVPPQQLLDLAQQISQELEPKPPSQPSGGGGNNDGH
jgi:hypothetical protein